MLALNRGTLHRLWACHPSLVLWSDNGAFEDDCTLRFCAPTQHRQECFGPVLLSVPFNQNLASSLLAAFGVAPKIEKCAKLNPRAPLDRGI
jgi:hypothetical protein